MVGGTHFKVLRKTLCAIEDSSLASMFSGRWDLEGDEDGNVFFDWDADRFKMILNELRDCSLDSTRKMRIPDPPVRPLWGYLALPLPRIFDGSRILLTDEHREWLHDVVMESANRGIGDEIATIIPKLLYECRGIGKSADFHESCDGKGATLTVVRCSNGYVFGGYHSGSWTSPPDGKGYYGRGENSFLFSLVNPAGTAPTKYNVTNPGLAVYNKSTCGPVFGHDDLVFWNHAGRSSSTFFPHSYEDTTGRGAQTFAGGDVRVHANGRHCTSFFIDRLEVWSVEPSSEDLKKPLSCKTSNVYLECI